MTAAAARETAAPDAVASGLQPRRRAVAVAAVLSSMALVVLDAGVVNLALPTIAGALRVPAGAAVLVVTAYQAAVLMALLPCGALGERLGYRRVFASGVALFTAASLLSALAPSLTWLVAARFLQGLGGAAIMSVGVALLRFSVPADRLGSAIGWNAMTIALCSAAGPAVGALVLTLGDWPWLFALNLPLGLGVLLATRALPVTRPGGRAIDGISVLLNAALFALLIAGAECLPVLPGLAVALWLAAILALVALVRRERSRTAPLIPFDLLGQRSFATAVIASVCCFAGQTVALIALPFLLHDAGLSALETGLQMTVWPLAVAVAAGVVGRFTDRTPSAWLCAAGGACLAAGLAGVALQAPDADSRSLAPLLALCGLGFGLFQTPNNRTLFMAASPERSGAAGGMQGTARLTGQTTGAVLVTLLFATTSVEATPRIALVAGAALALTAALVSASRGRSG